MMPPPVSRSPDEHDRGSYDGRPPASPYSSAQRLKRLIKALGITCLLCIGSAIVGYAVGVARVKPDSGESAQLNEVIKSLGKKADSLQDELNAKKTLQDELEAESARKPRVIIKEPGVLVIQPTDPHALEPTRTIIVPVEVSDVLASERKINDVLRQRVTLYAAQVKTLRARGDSLERAVDVARRGQRGPLLTVGLGGGKDMVGAWNAKVDAGVHAGRTWSLNIELTKPMIRNSEAHGLVYVRWQVVAWPR